MLLTSQDESGVLNLSLGLILTYKVKTKKPGLTGKMDMIIDITYLRKKSLEIKIKPYAESERDLGLLNHKLDRFTKPLPISSGNPMEEEVKSVRSRRDGSH